MNPTSHHVFEAVNSRLVPKRLMWPLLEGIWSRHHSSIKSSSSRKDFRSSNQVRRNIINFAFDFFNSSLMIWNASLWVSPKISSQISNQRQQIIVFTGSCRSNRVRRQGERVIQNGRLWRSREAKLQPSGNVDFSVCHSYVPGYQRDSGSPSSMWSGNEANLLKYGHVLPLFFIKMVINRVTLLSGAQYKHQSPAKEKNLLERHFESPTYWNQNWFALCHFKEVVQITLTSIGTDLNHKSNPFLIWFITYSCNPFFLHQRTMCSWTLVVAI